ncbi:unnamed protein product [Effrenium voratum]|uniref:Isochorismatase-like domain-containing protein n=1 Tax=Effrenium voratum TaxID=2562239 RepID=A0AA36J2C6_9DINO|nr:unnamed protein product [Effrenium voratum]
MAEPPERYALVMCDAQPDLLNSLPEEARSELLRNLQQLLEGARRANWQIVFTGLRFPSGYAGVPKRHRVFGGLQRLNEKQGDERVHWFMEGFPGTDIAPDLAPLEGEEVLWRQRMRPDDRLLDVLRAKNITKVAVAGLKTGQGVLQAAELLADDGLLLYLAPLVLALSAKYAMNIEGVAVMLPKNCTYCSAKPQRSGLNHSA